MAQSKQKNNVMWQRQKCERRGFYALNASVIASMNLWQAVLWSHIPLVYRFIWIPEAGAVQSHITCRLTDYYPLCSQLHTPILLSRACSTGFVKEGPLHRPWLTSTFSSILYKEFVRSLWIHFGFTEGSTNRLKKGCPRIQMDWHLTNQRNEALHNSCSIWHMQLKRLLSTDEKCVTWNS